MQVAFLALLLAFAPIALAADDFKVIKLEQDVRNLEQQVRELSRQLAQLQRDSGSGQVVAPRQRAAPVEVSTQWLDAGNWGRVHTGMSELEVIGVLGPPTSMRTDADTGARTLFYAMEIGSSGFLGGHVVFAADRKVSEVSKPELR